MGDEIAVDFGAPDVAAATEVDAMPADRAVRAAGVVAGSALPKPRGGATWPMSYAARRIAWHVLDHAWEMEDRRA